MAHIEINPAVKGSAAMADELDTGRDFGDLLRGYRLRTGQTQQQVAGLSTVSVRAIRDLEQGRARRPRKSTVELLADAMRLSDRDRAVLVEAAERSACESRSTVHGHKVPTVLPTACHPLLGREREVESLVRMLTTPGRRILNVTGAPGAGKGRLALEVAARVHSMAQVPALWMSEEGQGHASLASPHRSDGLDAILRGALRELCPRGEDGTDGSGVDALAEAVGSRPALLVLDVPREGAPKPAQFNRLLAVCPELRMLAIGSRTLGLPGERVVTLDPLNQADALRVLTSHQGLELPEEAKRNHRALEEICHLLDGLPGALIAVSSWFAVYDGDTLLDCLREDPLPFLSPLFGSSAGEMVRSLREVLGDCSESENRLLDLLCASPEGESADSLARTAGMSPVESGRALNDLIVRGLVHRDTGSTPFRFRALNMVRALNPVAGPRNADTAAVRFDVPA